MVGKNFCLALSAVWCLLLSLAARCSVTFHRASLTLTVCAVVTLGGAAIAGKIYQWTDEQGNIHFGDRPPVGDQDTVEDISDRIKSGDIRLDKPTGIEDLTLDEVQAEIREILKRNANGMPVILAEDIKKFA